MSSFTFNSISTKSEEPRTEKISAIDSEDLSSQIEIEQIKLKNADQQIAQLQQHILKVKQSNSKKASALSGLRDKLSFELSRNKAFADGKGLVSAQQSKPSLLINNGQVQIQQSKGHHAQILAQLKEHFRALKGQGVIFSPDQHFENGEGYDDDNQEYVDEVDVDNMTYEELLELGDKIGKVSKGLDEKKLNDIKTFQYDSPKQEASECTICRDDFEQGQSCMIFGCEHFLHLECAKQWLKVEKHCPNCKVDVREVRKKEVKVQTKIKDIAQKEAKTETHSIVLDKEEAGNKEFKVKSQFNLQAKGPQNTGRQQKKEKKAQSAVNEAKIYQLR